MAAAEGARQAAVLRATSLEGEVSGLRASAAEAAVAAKTVAVEAREEAARLSRELDVATEAAVSEEKRAEILAAELANVKAAAVTAEESTKAAVAEAFERAEAEREKAVGNAKTIRILEEQTIMARRTAEEAQSRLEAMGTETEALREKAQTSEGRVAKVGSFCFVSEGCPICYKKCWVVHIVWASVTSLLTDLCVCLKVYFFRFLGLAILYQNVLSGACARLLSLLIASLRFMFL